MYHKPGDIMSGKEEKLAEIYARVEQRTANAKILFESARDTLLSDDPKVRDDQMAQTNAVVNLKQSMQVFGSHPVKLNEIAAGNAASWKMEDRKEFFNNHTVEKFTDPHFRLDNLDKASRELKASMPLSKGANGQEIDPYRMNIRSRLNGQLTELKSEIGNNGYTGKAYEKLGEVQKTLIEAGGNPDDVRKMSFPYSLETVQKMERPRPDGQGMTGAVPRGSNVRREAEKIGNVMTFGAEILSREEKGAFGIESPEKIKEFVGDFNNAVRGKPRAKQQEAAQPLPGMSDIRVEDTERKSTANNFTAEQESQYKDLLKQNMDRFRNRDNNAQAGLAATEVAQHKSTGKDGPMLG